MRLAAGLVAAALALAPLPANAVNPWERLDDPALEERARDISAELRCLVCQNQSIDDSNADMAKDMRLLVRERLKAGDSDEEVIAYLTERYGDFVRLNPPLKASTIMLWTLPFVVGLIALVASLVYVRGRRTVSTGMDATLSDEESAQLERILAERRSR
jgi:cytochrome c-type biogenesis protein CcmH